MRTTPGRLLLGAVIALALPFAAVPSARAAASGDGLDVSWPQCDQVAADPPVGAFTIVGVNNGLGTTTNQCLASELRWAAGASAAGSPTTDLYVMAQHPAPAAASWWPTSNRTHSGATVPEKPYGVCSGAHPTTAACAYVYGFSIAVDDLGRVAQPAGYRWWLDVENGTDGPDWSSSTTGNQAVVTGMAAAFRAAGAAVGLYSTKTMWASIVGPVAPTSVLAGLPAWRTGASTSAGAAALCAATGFTGGAVVFAQYVADGTLDHDVRCASFASAPAPTVTGTMSRGHRLTAHPGTWSPGGAHLSYQWRRNGVAIAHATGATHTVTTADAGRRLTVTVTGTKSGYRLAVRTSKSHTIAKLHR